MHIAYSALHAEGAYILGREGVAVFWIGLLLGIALVAYTLMRVRRSNQSHGTAPNTRRAVFWLWCCLVIFGAAIISYTALWLQYTPEGVPGVMGVQYRYFLPYLPFAVMMIADCASTIRSLHKPTRLHSPATS